MTNNENYKFVGIINLFGVYPDFVYPIFQKDNKFYFQKTENTIIKSFNKIKDSLCINMIHFLNSDNTKFINVRDIYTIGEEAAVAFQTDKDEFIASDISGFVSFINKFITDDHILIEQIDTFLDAVSKKKYDKKEKYLIKYFSFLIRL